MATETMRERQVNVRFNEEEWARAERVAQHYGLNVPGLVRMLLKREHDAIAGLTLEQREVFSRLYGTVAPIALRPLAQVLGRTPDWTKPILEQLEARGAVVKSANGFMPTLEGARLYTNSPR